MLSEAEKQFYPIRQKIAEGKTADAVDLLFDFTNRFPDFGKAHCELGIILLRDFNEQQAAEVSFKKAIAIAPEYYFSYLYLTDILISQERFPELIANLNKLSGIAGAPKDKVYEKSGRMYELQMKYDEAIGYYKRAIGSSFSQKDILDYEQAIARCQLKKKY